MGKLVSEVLAEGGQADRLFDRLAEEYRAKGHADQQEMFLAVVAELAAAQMAVRAVVRR
jgi:hypothetical protein